MPMTSNELMTSLREMKKTNPAEYAVFQKDYAEEMTEGVSYWGVNNGYLTLWKLHEEVEDEFDYDNFGNKWCLGEEWGGLSGIQTRTITKKMVERENFEEHESDDEEEEVGLSSCPKCENTYTQKQIDDGEVVPCNRCYKCFVGECGKDNCECEPEEVYYILSDYNLTAVEDKPSLEEYEEESRLVVDGRTEITYKKKESDEGGNEEDEEEECDCGCGLPSPCYIDDPKTVRRENEKDKEETKKAMKDYVKARLNHLMGLGQKQMMDDGGDGAVECLFTRLEEWDGEEFDNILCSLCDKRDGELNASKSGYEFLVGAEMTEKDDKVWEVSVSWSTLYDQNPFDDFYDEDEDNGSDSDDE